MVPSLNMAPYILDNLGNKVGVVSWVKRYQGPRSQVLPWKLLAPASSMCWMRSRPVGGVANMMQCRSNWRMARCWQLELDWRTCVNKMRGGEEPVGQSLTTASLTTAFHSHRPTLTETTPAPPGRKRPHKRPPCASTSS